MLYVDLNSGHMSEVLNCFWDYRAKWRVIGIELGINIGTLDAIDLKYRNPEDCLTELIVCWLRGSNPRPTRSTMTMILQSKHVTGGSTSVQGV